MKPEKEPEGVEGDEARRQKKEKRELVDGVGNGGGSVEKETQRKQLLQKVESTAPSDSK